MYARIVNFKKVELELLLVIGFILKIKQTDFYEHIVRTAPIRQKKRPNRRVESLKVSEITPRIELKVSDFRHECVLHNVNLKIWLTVHMLQFPHQRVMFCKYTSLVN